MQLIYLFLSALLFSTAAFAKGRDLNEKMLKLKELQQIVARECIGKNPNVTITVDKKKYTCPQMLVITERLRKELDEEMKEYEQECLENNRKTPEALALADQAANIAQQSATCKPSLDNSRCFGRFSCGLVNAFVPVMTLAYPFSNNEKVKQCVNATAGMPACFANVMRGIVDSIWTTLTLIWDIGKIAVTKTGEWLGIIKESEAKTSERAMLAQQAGPGFLKSLMTNPVETINKMASDMFNALQESAMEHYGCEKWAGAPFASACKKKMTTWNCGTCQQKTQVFCGIAGYAAGEIVTAYLTGGITSGAKVALKGAMKLSAGPARAVGGFMARTFPKAATEVAEQAARVRALATIGLNATQKALVSSWHTIANSRTSKAIAVAAAKVSASAAGEATKVVLSPVTWYLGALEKAFVAGGNAVDNVVAKTALGAARQEALLGTKIADEAMGITAGEEVAEAAKGGLVVESSQKGATGTGAQTANAQASSQAGQRSSTVEYGSDAEKVRAAQIQEASQDIKVYRADPEYSKLFKGPEMYKDHHEELAVVIKTLEDAHPKMSKLEVRKFIEEKLSACQL